ncbi:MAG: hypothetical protein QM611_04665 [Microbacterium sp.]|uniref:hypothetical protein n=1 Tax=Microbacterium sp. TaxID=51671 RepID=UPI0039E5A172
MLILLALIFGAVVGLVVHFTLPHRDTRGSAVGATLGAVVGGGVWLAFTWLGMEQTGWIWLASLAAPIAVVWLSVAVLSRARLAHDRRERERLKIA